MNSFFSRRNVITIIIAVAIAAAVIVIAVWQEGRSFDNYDVEKSFSIDGASSQKFVSF